MAPELRESPAAAPPVSLHTLEEMVALAKARGARHLATLLEGNVHLVALEPGRIEFRQDDRAPRTLAGDLAQKLRDWTGVRWIVTLASEGGAPSLLEQRMAAERARKDAVANEPFVRAVLDAFPGAEIVAVRDKEVVETVEPPESEES
jgi:DNA polymerase-3 subunit gamma/tau